jgi:hypothetical protein
MTNEEVRQIANYRPKDRLVILRDGNRQRVIGPLPFKEAIRLTQRITSEDFKDSETWPAND